MTPEEKWFTFLDKHPAYVVKVEQIGNNPRAQRFTAAHAKKSGVAQKREAKVIGMDFNEFPQPAEMMGSFHQLILDTGRTLRPDGIYVPKEKDR